MRGGIRLSFESGTISDGACGICGPIAAVGSCAEYDCFGQTGNIECGGQNELLIAASQSFALERHCGLTARDNAGWRPHGRTGADHLPRNRCVHASDLTRFALNFAGEHQ